MTPIERYTFLKQFWMNKVLECEKDLNEASDKYEHWSNKLVEAEIVNKLENEK